MKSFILKVSLFFTLMVVADIIAGYCFEVLRKHAKGGTTENYEYIANKAMEDVIILGSSRATHHYIPSIIEDSLGVSCYNCGEEGNGIVLAYGRYKQLTARYKPKLIVYELTPVYDYSFKEPDSKYLGFLRPYYKQKEIKEIFDDFGDELVTVKMMSSMYQNSERLIPNIISIFVSNDNFKGYKPLFGKKTSPIHVQELNTDIAIDNHKLKYLERLILESKKNNIPIVFAVSPICEKGDDSSRYHPVIDLCNKYDIPFLNFKSCAGIYDHPELFQDDLHLNNEGAEMYSSFFASEIRELFKEIL